MRRYSPLLDGRPYDTDANTNARIVAHLSVCARQIVERSPCAKEARSVMRSCLRHLPKVV